MALQPTSEEVWEAIGKATFGVLGMVTSRGHARTVGMVYVVDNNKLYMGAAPTQWKTKHITRNRHVSMTIPIPRRVPFLPWIKVPAATITFSGTAKILERDDIGTDLLRRLYRHEDGRAGWCAIEVTPEKDFITYGVNISLLQMRHPDRSRGRTPVAAA